MNTRFSSLVTIKKSSMQKSERVLQNANTDLNSATSALEKSYKLLNDVTQPKQGSISEMLASRVLLDSQRGIIEHNKEWVDFAQKQLLEAKEKLKLDTIEHEKFKYLELEEIKKIIKAQKIKESKELDEIALITHENKKGLR
jgi:flagellar biosynthesis chaperone FliJ